jgi:hypothetical protein
MYGRFIPGDRAGRQDHRVAGVDVQELVLARRDQRKGRERFAL